MPITPFIDVRAPGFDVSSTLSSEGLISFVYEESMYGCAKWALNLASSDSGKYDAFIRGDGGAGRRFRFRFGLRNLDTPMPLTGSLESSWKTLELLISRKRTWGETTVFNFKGLCYGNVLNRRIGTGGGWHKTKISEIVKEIAEGFRFNYEIEDTVGEYTLNMGKCKYGAFIKNYLLPLAYGRSSRKDWRFWIKDGNTLVFKPVDVNVGPKHFFSDRTGEDSSILVMLGPEVVKSVVSQVWDGSGRHRVEVHDPKDNKFQYYEVSDENAMFNYGGPGAPIERSRGTHTVSSTHFTEGRNLDGKTTQEQLMHEATTRFSRYARSLYKLVAEVPFAVGMYPGDLVEVRCGDTEGADEASGMWVLSLIRTVCTRGELKCFVVLERRWERDSVSRG